VKPSKNSLKKWTNRVKNNLGDTSYLNKIGSELQFTSYFCLLL